ncbi:MAG: sigma-70 family RNA polymerase sigma factor [Alphaproteobacteria bacterium]
MDGFETELLRALPRLRAFARRLTDNDAALADDLVQDTCVNALRAAGRYQLNTNIDAWLATILRNRFLSLAKRHARRLETTDDELVQRTSAGTVPQHGRLEMMALERAFARLRPAERRALVLATTEDRSYRDIAHDCDCAVGTVKSRVSRARSRLAVELDRQDPHRPGA